MWRSRNFYGLPTFMQQHHHVKVHTQDIPAACTSTNTSGWVREQALSRLDNVTVLWRLEQGSSSSRLWSQNTVVNVDVLSVYGPVSCLSNLRPVFRSPRNSTLRGFAKVIYSRPLYWLQAVQLFVSLISRSIWHMAPFIDGIHTLYVYCIYTPPPCIWSHTILIYMYAHVWIYKGLI